VGALSADGGSPAMARNVIRMNIGMDIRNLLPAIVQPTLILHRTGDTWIDVAHARYLAERLLGELRRAPRI
jgi:pimeloyl-ACP methyl ester carboxylesterase